VTAQLNLRSPSQAYRSRWSVVRWTEPVVDALGRSSGLNRLGRWLSRTFYGVVKHGRLKDVLAGTWMAHPAHPMLTDVTIGAWSGAAVLDLLGGEKGRPGADLLVGLGILSAVPTAVTGLSELTDTVESEDRSIATAHALTNVGGLVLWCMSFAARKGGRRRAATTLGLAATAAMTAAGFLGGHLSYRLGLGVDQTAFDPKIEEWTAVMDDRELQDDRPRRIMVSGTNVFLVRTGGMIHALANRCSHRGGPLNKGTVEDQTVTCPWHLSTFRLDDGSVLRGPATAPQPTYETRVRDGKVEIRQPL
jgi:nitrite reductase/ring-hydroxylating ferredoxin subunit